MVFNSQTHSFYEYSLKKSNIRYDVRSLLLEGDNLWVGTYAEGLHVLNLKTGNIKSYTYSRNIPNTLCSNDVLSLLKTVKEKSLSEQAGDYVAIIRNRIIL